jgi:cell shape-determining protein MreC
MNRFNGIIAIALFLIAFVVADLFFIPKTYVNSAIIQVLQAPRLFIRALANQHELFKQLSAAQLENQSLRAKIIILKNQPTLAKFGQAMRIQATVYSQYPLSSTGRIIIAAGREEGVREGQVVTVAPDVFLGVVSKTYDHSSEVKTLYDLGWELPVKIGSNKLDSLLIGGHEPRLTLISKKKPADAGMEVYLASSKYPYGLLVGSMGDPMGSEQNLFQEASLTLPYSLSDTQVVYVSITE